MSSDAENKKPKKLKKVLTLEEIEFGRSSIISGVLEGKKERLQDKVAWILNHFPDTRDSDISLSLRFWEKFESEYYNSGYIIARDLFKLTKQTSLTRERARIQNIYKLYLASPDVRKMRGKLQDEELEKALEENLRYPVSIVYADESGKNENYLLVGSLWFVALLSFKGIYLKRISTRKDEDSLEHLFYHLIVKGLDHDH